MAAKKCSKCGEEKPATQEFFYAQKGCADGLRPDCKNCVRSRVMRHHFANHEATKTRLRNAHWANRDERIASAREYYRNNKARLIGQVLRWAKDNRQRVYSYQHNWRAAKRAGGVHTVEQIFALYKEQGGRCPYCLVELGNRYHRDHIVPLSHGGSNDISNIQLLCPSCNTSKGAKTHEEFVKTRSLTKEDANDGRCIKHPSGMV